MELVEFGLLAELEPVRKVYIGWGRYVYDIRYVIDMFKSRVELMEWDRIENKINQ